MYQDYSDIRRITNAEKLRQMLAQCEDEIMRLAKGSGKGYYWPRDCEELVREELSTRCCILNHMFELHCTPAEVRRFEEVNATLLKLEQDFNKWSTTLNGQFSQINGLDGEPFKIDMAINGYFDEETPLFSMEEDVYYGSRWHEMIEAISQNSVIDAMTDLHDDVEDSVCWAEGPLCIPQLEHVCVCHLIHALCTHLDYSIPDILRMTTYRIDYRMDCSDFITLTPGETEPFKRFPIQDETASVSSQRTTMEQKFI